MKLYIDIGTLVAHLIRYMFAPFFSSNICRGFAFLVHKTYANYKRLWIIWMRLQYRYINDDNMWLSLPLLTSQWNKLVANGRFFILNKKWRLLKQTRKKQPNQAT